MNNGFTPQIIAFLCNWCSYAGADKAGGRHDEAPQGLKVVRVMCSGRVEPRDVIECFTRGADGVLILGCHPGDCHYKEGNHKALRRYHLLKKMLPQFGIENERVKLDWVSSNEAKRYTEIVNEMAKSISRLGPFNEDGKQ